MSFLALSPAGLAALLMVTTALVIVLFFLKLRHRRVVVGSSLLWNRVLDDRQAHSLMERLRRLLSLLLTLVIALLIATALGRPWLGEADQPPRLLVVVLDTSPSMGARAPGGATRWERAASLARQILSGSRAVTGYMIADTAGRVRTSPASNPAPSLDALEGMEPIPGVQSFPALPDSDAEVYFITDGVAAMNLPDSVRELSVFEPAENVAITAFDLLADTTSPTGFRALIEVVNFGTRPAEVGLLLSGAGDQREPWRLDLNEGEAWRENLDLAAFRGGPLRLRLEAADDGLGLDDTAYGYLPPRNSIRVDLVTNRVGGYLETLLALSPRVDLRVVPPSGYRDDPAVTVYVFEGFAPRTAPRAPTIVFGATDAPWLPPARGIATDPRVTRQDRDHPVMAQVPLHDVSIARAPVLDAGGWTVLAASGATPLILVAETNPPRALVAFDLADSDFPFHLGFPLLVENLLAWSSGEGLARSADLGWIRIEGLADAVTSLDGTLRSPRPEFGGTLIEAREPDLLTASVEGRRVRVAANLLDWSSSDLNRSRLAGQGPGPEPGEGQRELWPILLLAAALLAALEWWAWHRRVTL